MVEAWSGAVTEEEWQGPEGGLEGAVCSSHTPAVEPGPAAL